MRETPWNMVSRVGGYEELDCTHLCAAVSVNGPHEYDLGGHVAQVAQKAEEVKNHRGRGMLRS
jgi:hypothetical protein